MDWSAFLYETINELVASIPEIILMLLTVVFGLRKVNNTTAAFPFEVSSVKETLKNAFNDTSAILKNSFDISANDLKKVFENTSEQLKTKVADTMGKMQDELSSYKAELQTTKDQLNLFVKENKLYIDLILDLVAKNSQKVKDGIAQIISNKLNMTKAELEKYPEQLVNDLGVLEKAINEVKSVAGIEALDALLGKIGYERKA